MMSTKVQIGAYNDVTGESYTVEKEIEHCPGMDIHDETRVLIEQLNKENSIILYYLLGQEGDKTQTQGSSSGSTRRFDKWDTL